MERDVLALTLCVLLSQGDLDNFGHQRSEEQLVSAVALNFVF